MARLAANQIDYQMDRQGTILAFCLRPNCHPHSTFGPVSTWPHSTECVLLQLQRGYASPSCTEYARAASLGPVNVSVYMIVWHAATWPLSLPLSTVLALSCTPPTQMSAPLMYRILLSTAYEVPTILATFFPQGIAMTLKTVHGGPRSAAMSALLVTTTYLTRFAGPRTYPLAPTPVMQPLPKPT